MKVDRSRDDRREREENEAEAEERKRSEMARGRKEAREQIPHDFPAIRPIRRATQIAIVIKARSP